jgi:hypothetical protein
MAEAVINMGDMAKRITVHVKVVGRARWAIRATVGLWLVRLGIAVMGFGLEVEE